MIVDNGNTMASSSIFPDGDGLAEELQVQEVILFSACQEMIIQDTSLDSIGHLIRRNHKQEPKMPCSIADPGQSSSPITSPDDEFYCTICMERRPSACKFSIGSCRHAFCLSCIGQYVAAKIDENTAHVRCPDPGCRDGAVEPESCRGVIPSELFNKWGFALCESALGAKRLYCPFRDCSARLLAEGEGSIAEAECPHCHRLFCARCMVPWHDGVSCEEFQELGEDERGGEDAMVRRLSGRERWQRCPQCRMYVEKSEGCMFVQCRCGCCFCYACASPMSKELHYCKRCKR